MERAKRKAREIKSKATAVGGNDREGVNERTRGESTRKRESQNQPAGTPALHSEVRARRNLIQENCFAPVRCRLAA